MNVLSLFDGMSCAFTALKRINATTNNYFASEIDKYAIKIANKNHPEIIQMSDITNWQSWNLPKIDLLVGGPPCQGFSIAGNRLNFKDPRSKLFLTTINLLKELKPKYFLLENVASMKREIREQLDELIGVKSVMINSSLVSAQNRKRLYWFNWDVPQPQDKGVILKDIIENGAVDRDKSYCLDANYFKGGNLKSYFEKGRRQLVFNCIQTGIADLNGYDCIKRTYSIYGKAPTLTTMGGGHREPKITTLPCTWRKLTPLECERLQTLPDNYTEGVSNTQRYKMIGNGMTVDVIAHILRNSPL